MRIERTSGQIVKKVCKVLDIKFLKRIVRAPMKKRHEKLFAFEPGIEPRSYLCARQLRGIRMASLSGAAMR